MATNLPFPNSFSYNNGQQEVLVMRSAMPMPSAVDAPTFTGKNLRIFLNDYNVGTSEAGWPDPKKCERLPFYCSSKPRLSVVKMAAFKAGDWKALEKELATHYHLEEYQPKYSRSDIEKFTKESRQITKKKHLTEYYREFMLRIEYLKPKHKLTSKKSTKSTKKLKKKKSRKIFDDSDDSSSDSSSNSDSDTSDSDSDSGSDSDTESDSDSDFGSSHRKNVRATLSSRPQTQTNNSKEEMSFTNGPLLQRKS
jgi:hypothetical protein